jgi:excisionase family DNA binding protein
MGVLIQKFYETSTLFVFFFFFLRDRRSIMPKKSVSQMFRKYPDVLTIPQVCEMLGVSRNYAYLLVKQGKLTRLDLGRIIRVTKSSVIELKEKSLQKSENSPV